MAGRGTDIKLGEGVREVGGLHVIVSESHDAGRIDRQLAGRCARQGDPGSFEFYYSAEDVLLEGNRAGVAQWAVKLYPQNAPLWAVRGSIGHPSQPEKNGTGPFTNPARGPQAGRKDGHAAFLFGSGRIGSANNILGIRGIMMRKKSFMLLLATVFAVSVPGVATAQRAESHEGMMEPHVTVSVASQVSGILEEVLVQRGDIVTKGQVLATLRAGVEKADMEQASALLDFNRRKLVRNNELFAKGNISANDEDEMETEIKKDEAILHQVAAKLEMKTIRSPVDGVVVKVDLTAGEYVGEKPIMTIAQIDPLNVEVVVPVSEYGTIKKDMLRRGPAGVSRGRSLHGKGHHRRPRGERRERQLRGQGGIAQSQPRDSLRAEMQRQVQGE